MRYFLISVLWSMAGALMADEQVIIDTDEKAKEFLLNYTYVCDWKDAYFSGTSEVNFEEASLKKVIGKNKNSACSGKLGTFKGKFKKSELVGTTSGYNPPCGAVSTKSKIFKMADGGYIAKDTYFAPGYNGRGTSTCKMIPK